MPPRQGQSQLISPVSELNAPSFPASCSSCSGDFSASVAAVAVADWPSWLVVVGCAVAALDACFAACSSLAFSRASICLRFSSTIASTVGRSDSENCGGSGERCATSKKERKSFLSVLYAFAMSREGREGRTWHLVRKEGAGVVPVECTNRQPPSRGCALPCVFLVCGSCACEPAAGGGCDKRRVPQRPGA